MTPCMTSNLMTFSIHTLYNCWIACVGIIDLAFATVITNNEKGRFDIVGFENIEEFICPNVRTVIEGQGNFARNCTMLNAHTIREVSKFWPRNRGSIFSRRNLIRVACRSILKKATWSVAEWASCTTYALEVRSTSSISLVDRIQRSQDKPMS